jgi:hypothetical protein
MSNDRYGPRQRRAGRWLLLAAGAQIAAGLTLASSMGSGLTTAIVVGALCVSVVGVCAAIFSLFAGRDDL